MCLAREAHTDCLPQRQAAGLYSSYVDDGQGHVTGINFPPINATHPDYARHPLFRHARVATFDVPEGAALLLPAGWFHQVESFAPPTGLNVAIQYWFRDGALSGVLHAVMREPRHGLYVASGTPWQSTPSLVGSLRHGAAVPSGQLPQHWTARVDSQSQPKSEL